MFEEEKEIRLRDYKKVRYMVSFLKNIILYQNKKVNIPVLEVWGSSQCNLKCKECISRIPFVQQKKMCTDKVIQSIAKLSGIAKLNRIIISGGEPFLNSDLHRIVSCVVRLPEVKKIYIVTNAMFMPDEKIMGVLSKAVKPIKIVMNEYQGVANRIKDIKIELEKRGIRYRVRKLGTYRWNGIGNDICHPLHFETGRMIYADCRMRNYAVLHENMITKCPRGILYSQKSNIKHYAVEHIKISDLKCGTVSRAKLAVCLDQNIHKEYCRNCFGLSNENPYLDEPGIQIKE